MGLPVKSIKKRDAGRGIAAILEHIVEQYNIDRGKYILLKDDGEKTLARVYPGTTRMRAKM